MTGENSALDAARVAERLVSVDGLTCAQGALWWLQSDPRHSGATRLMRWTLATGPEAVTDPRFSVGGWLHAYGGGAFAATGHGIWVVGNDGALNIVGPDSGVPELVLTPRTADAAYGDLFAAGDFLLAVRGGEDGDAIVEVDLRTRAERVLVRAPGFLGAPRLHNGHLAYLKWDADRMPWDASCLLLAEHRPGRELGPSQPLAGGADESVVQPVWGPDGTLYFISDRTGWWNLYAWRDAAVRALAPMNSDCAPAPWEAGYQSYAFLTGGRTVLTVRQGARTQLVLREPDGTLKELCPELTSAKPYAASLGDQLAVIAAESVTTPAVWLISPGAGRTAAAATRLVGEDSPCAAKPPQRRVLARAGAPVDYLLHLPAEATRGPVPLLVRAHPGPTDSATERLDLTVQYFVGHGFAVADVDYRGSTGRGRAYRQALYGHWGTFDADDCQDVARALVDESTARAGAVFLTGASAGGYTALQAARRAGSPFAGVTAVSAITDPARWANSVPRFQRAHALALAGPAGAVEAKDIDLPVLMIHGTGDTVAPADDVRQLAAALREAGTDHETLFLDGAGHYLSEPSSRRAALEAELAFYRRLMSAQLRRRL
ncbi:S9 family peptidase [Sphaerimonospora thailandensis]|uniref:Peptidase n=1 Tax=Sphaerimonospora thailandensis TaxID=795644 RepID=A0A8J3R6L7_9ACTN|nr:prolyl oligopeptidase family serine peptidase [Sphaerimonospora thailandensis]GIH68781.1 peptidase [Sphaerimonospora thailandensis]